MKAKRFNKLLGGVVGHLVKGQQGRVAALQELSIERPAELEAWARAGEPAAVAEVRALKGATMTIDPSVKGVKKKARKQERRTAAKAFGLSVPEYRAVIAVAKVKQARDSGADTATLAKLITKATARVDALAMKVGLAPTPPAAATGVARSADGGMVTLLGPTVLSQLPPAEGTLDVTGLRDELRKSLATPRSGDGWRP